SSCSHHERFPARSGTAGVPTVVQDGMTRRHALASVAVLTAAATLLSACGSSPSAHKSAAKASPTAGRGWLGGDADHKWDEAAGSGATAALGGKAASSAAAPRPASAEVAR